MDCFHDRSKSTLLKKLAVVFIRHALDVLGNLILEKFDTGRSERVRFERVLPLVSSDH